MSTTLSVIQTGTVSVQATATATVNNVVGFVDYTSLPLFTVSGGASSPYFTGFDPTLGTLDDVTLTFSLSGSASGDLSPFAGALTQKIVTDATAQLVPLSGSTSNPFADSDADYYPLSISSQTGPYTPGEDTIPIGPYSIGSTSSGQLLQQPNSRFDGGSYEFGLGFEFSGGGNPGRFTTGDSLTVDLTATVTIEYDYTPKQPLIIDGPAGGFGKIEGTAQPTLIQAFGYVNTIYANGGNDSITAGSGNDTVYTDGGSDSIILGGFFNTVSSGDGSHGTYAVSGDSGNDTVLGGSGNNTVVLGNGNDKVEIGGGGNLVNVGNGIDTINLTGSNNTIIAGSPSGTDTITLGTTSGGDEQVMGGNGNFSVNVGGTGDTVTLGNGDNTVFALQGMAFITTGAGNDTITLGGSGSTVNAGGGTNFITGGTGGDTFVLPVARTGFDFIANFTAGNGDLLDLIPALGATNWNGQANSLANYVQVSDAGGNAVISISPTGSVASVGIAVLQGAGNLGLSGLLSHLQT